MRAKPRADRRLPDFADFEAAERAHPHAAAVHLAAAMAWAAALGLAKAPEGIAFAVLATVGLVRFRWTAPLYGALARSPIAAAACALAAWHLLSIAWTSSPSVHAGEPLMRAIAVPAMLWPVIHRWRHLMAALLAGCTGQGIATLVRSWDGAGFRTYMDSSPLIGHLFSAALAMAAGAIVAWCIVIGLRGTLPRIMASLAMAACVGALLVLENRTMLVGLGFGAVAATAFTMRGTRRGGAQHRMRPLPAIGTLAVVAGVVASLLFSGRMDQVRARIRAQDAGAAEASYVASGGRTALWRGAWEIGMEHPLAGAGMQSWRVEFGGRCLRQPEAYGVPRSEAAAVAALPSAHQTYLSEFCEYGLVGLGLLLALLWFIARGIWRQDDGWDMAAAAGLLAAWVVAGFAERTTTIGFSVLVLMLIATRAAVPCDRRATNA